MTSNLNVNGSIVVKDLTENPVCLYFHYSQKSYKWSSDKWIQYVETNSAAISLKNKWHATLMLTVALTSCGEGSS